MRSLDTGNLAINTRHEIQRWEDDGGAVPPDPELVAEERAARRLRMLARAAAANAVTMAADRELALIAVGEAGR